LKGGQNNFGIVTRFLFIAAEILRISSNNMFYTKPVDNVNTSALAEFTAIEPQLSNTMRISNTTAFAKELCWGSAN
jgi:hypothetical protein